MNDRETDPTSPEEADTRRAHVEQAMNASDTEDSGPEATTEGSSPQHVDGGEPTPTDDEPPRQAEASDQEVAEGASNEAETSSAETKQAESKQAENEDAETKGAETKAEASDATPDNDEGGPLAKLPDVFSRAFLAQGFTELTEIQEAVLEADCEDRDLRLSSQTGSGKTVALGLVVGPLLLDSDEDRDGRPARGRKRPAAPKIVLIAPTRELAAQLGRELAWLYAGLGVRVAVVTGGTAIGGDFRALGDHPQLLIGTPGRLVDHLERGSLDLLDVEAVVLDEADEMLDMGFREELEKLLGAMPVERRTHMISATFPPKVLELADRYQDRPLLVEGQVGSQHADIEHIAMLVQPQDRFKALVNLLLLHPEGRVLVFVRTRVGASSLAGELSQHGFAVGALSGEMAQRERTRWLGEFRARRIQCLVATDVAARGLDIPGVQRVVHFDLPSNREAFTHRSGRTGRAGERGENVLLVAPRGRRRVEQQMRSVGVDIAWRTPPQASEIRQAARQRLLERFGADDGDAGDASESNEQEGVGAPSASRTDGSNDERFGDLVSIAESLLEERTAVDLVSDLLASVSGDVACEPFDLNPPRTPKGVAPRGEGSPSSHSRGGDYVPFHLTWGSRTGATPKRVLAHVCRRGGVDGSQVGAIQIREFQSVVDIAAKKAVEFESEVRRPDPRNPKVRISRFVSRERRGATSTGKPHRGSSQPEGRSGGSKWKQRGAKETGAQKRSRFERESSRPRRRGSEDAASAESLGGGTPRKRQAGKKPEKPRGKSTAAGSKRGAGKGSVRKGSKPPWAK